MRPADSERHRNAHVLLALLRPRLDPNGQPERGKAGGQQTSPTVRGAVSGGLPAALAIGNREEESGEVFTARAAGP
jgi:hypothetical protein